MLFGRMMMGGSLISSGTPSVVRTAADGNGKQTNAVLNIPAGVASGNTLVAILKAGESVGVNLTLPTGWSAVYANNAAPPSGTYGTWVLRKLADGSEGGTTVTFTFDITAYSTFYLVEVAGNRTVSVGYLYDSYDPPSLAPSGGSVATVWITAAGWRRTDNTMGGPSGWSNFLVQNPGDTGNVAYDANSETCRIGGATLVSTASSIDPPAFSLASGSIPSHKEVLTVAVR